MRWTFWVCWRQCCNNCYLDTVISRTGKLPLPLPLKLAQMRESRERERAEGFSQPACCRFGTPITGIESNYLVILTLRLFAVCRKTLCALRLVTIQVGLQVPPTPHLPACPALSWVPCHQPAPWQVDLATLDSHYTDLLWRCTFNTCFAMPRGGWQGQGMREIARGALEEI